jgi:nucleolin
VDEAIRETDSTFWHGRRIYVSKRTPRRQTESTKTPTRSLFIGNIPYETTDADLNKLFASIQGVVDVRVAVDRTTGWPRGFAHADFVDVAAAEAARTQLAVGDFNGRQLRIDFAETPRSRREPAE